MLTVGSLVELLASFPADAEVLTWKLDDVENDPAGIDVVGVHGHETHGGFAVFLELTGTVGD